VTQHLLDAGASEIGWSYYGDAFKCLHLFGLKRYTQLPDDSAGRTRGSLGHTGMAHLYARWQARQMKKDPDVFYDVEPAMAEWCRRHPEGAEWLPLMTEILRRYMARYPEAPGRIMGVEMPIRGVLGTREGRWGLWVLASGSTFDRSWRPGQPLPAAHIGGLIAPALLEMPGHVRHQEPIMITRRIDVSIQYGTSVDIMDHKFLASGVGPARARAYTMDGQFAVSRIFGQQLYGLGFGKATLNLVQTTDPFTVGRPHLPPTPHRDGRFAFMLHRKAHEIAQLERDELDVHDWPMTQHESVCDDKYSGCAGKEACAFGAAGLVK
jgi:hypothetical protein